ncbi:MAG: NAD(P)H-dependent oxidoreductase subunit E [Anaerolineae bacterium]|nr:NAD(P)H-dependent oxidoreductase subunit E [Anaerolineae bacterium]
MVKKTSQRISVASLDDLVNVAGASQEQEQQYRYHICICVAAGCISQNSDAVRDALIAEVEARGLEDEVQVKGVGCMGLCAAGPLVRVDPDGIVYQSVTVDDVPAILDSLENGPVEKLILPQDIPFFERQQKIVLENCGIIDPEAITEYIAAGGYLALHKALTEMTPSEVIDVVTRSGLRGRGGGGYPAGLKWVTVAKAESETKYVICNADEGDPGAFMDRSVLESDPHRVIEGMAIAGYAVGANKGYIYVRAEYPLAVERLELAIKQARWAGILGNGVFSTTFDFAIEVRLGAGAFVCGEETALIASIEGRRGVPRPRPPYPADYGLWGQPTLINNVETFANVAPIIRNGSDWFAEIGTEKSKGTKVFALAGQIVNTGLIEVPMGITLREIVFDIGGGLPDGRNYKAVQTGGPSGGCVPEQFLDMPVDYESLREVGSFMGSGGMIVMDDSSSMVEVARYFMEFSMTESCGKCIPCRTGTRQMYDLLSKVVAGEASQSELNLLVELGDLLQNTCLCGLGKAAPNPVVSTMQYFEDEYLERLVDDNGSADEPAGES